MAYFVQAIESKPGTSRKAAQAFLWRRRESPLGGEHGVLGGSGAGAGALKGKPGHRRFHDLGGVFGVLVQDAHNLFDGHRVVPSRQQS